MYAKGEGVLKDNLQAYYWFSIAASQGNELSKKAQEIVFERMKSPEH